MSTNASVDLVTKYLEQHGWSKYKVLEQEPDGGGKVLTGWRSSASEEGHPLVIHVSLAGNFIHFLAPRVAMAPKEETAMGELADLLLLMGQVNYSLILGRFSYDERDGEICFEYALPTDGAQITFEQFDHALRAVIHATDYWSERISELRQGERTVDSVWASYTQKTRLGGDILDQLRSILGD